MNHPITGFALGDPDASPLAKKPTPAEARTFFDTLILSASGWRGVFGASDDDMEEAIPPARIYTVARMAATFADFLLARQTAVPGVPTPAIALGIDTRPTGPAIADAMARVLIAKGLRVRYAFICAAPEIMAWTRRSAALPPGSPDRLDAFCYVSASHNPPGHNGVKFGLADGGVLSAPEAKVLTDALRGGACTAADIDAVAVLVGTPPARAVSSLYAGCATEKRKAISDYTLFAREVAGASADLSAQERELDALAAAVSARGAGIVADMNGSARTLSIDSDYLASLGVEFRRLNAVPRRFAHRIVPEGEALEPCRLALEKAHASEPHFVLGYVPDCDGDRGNLVYWDDDTGTARALAAQDTFALAVLAELATADLATADLATADLATMAARDGNAQPHRKIAVACNDATSLRIESIAKALGAEVFRAETGEANVVGLARTLREQGYEVRILGEGSNGGVITHPAGVRDPLNTVTAILKLLYVDGGDGHPGPYRLWLRRSGQESAYHGEFGLCDVLATMPRFTTTSVFEERAALRVRSKDQVALKGAYEVLFRKAWPSIAREIEPKLGSVSWKAYASLGSTQKELAGGFTGSGTGGLKIVLVDAGGSEAGFLWMRGSGTEPVFRVMADVRGNDAGLEALLLDRHVGMVREADSLV
jgi:phosphoglucomutase